MASGSGVVQWEAEPSGGGAVTEEGVKKRALGLESQGSFPHLSQRPLSCVGGRVPAGLRELTTGKGTTAQLCCEFVGSAVPFPGPGFILQARESL